MRTYITIKRLEAEIAKLNEEIDMRIIKGISYKILSRRHRMLVNQLRNLKGVSSANIFSRFTRYASVFLM